MNSFGKPQPLKTALKLALYGPAGSGKTFTSLLLAEGLAHHTGKRVAYVDTEHGTDFYAQRVSQRNVHPEAFDFDCLYTKSITDVLRAVRGLDANKHGVIVIDSLTHLWESCKDLYSGKRTRIGTIPLSAWGQIKKPYRELMALLLALPVHVILCGRQGTEYGEDPSGELKVLRAKMRAEGETAYEPDVLLRLEMKRTSKDVAIPTATVEKDRSGVLAGQTIAWPGYDNIAVPLIEIFRTGSMKMDNSNEVTESYLSRITQSATLAELQAIGEELTPTKKQSLQTTDIQRIRQSYGQRLKQFSRNSSA